MLDLTVDAIKDFQTCERLYDFRYNDDYTEKLYSRDIYSQRFENTLKNIIYYFFYKKQSGVVPSYSSILNRWEKLWFPKNTDYYDIVTEQHETAYGNTSSLTTKAAGILMKFYESFSDSDMIPISIKDDYNAVVGRNVKILDNYDLIFLKDNLIHVSKILFNYKMANSYMYQVDFATMYLGYINRHPERAFHAKYGYIDLLSDNISFNEYQVTSEDVDALQYWCDKIESTEVFIPRRGMTSYCKKCPYDKPCEKWAGWK